MAALILLRPGVDWTASGGLFDWTLEYLITRIGDRDAVEWLRQIVDNNLGSLWLPEFPVQTQEDIIAHLRSGLVETAERELPDSADKVAAARQLQELVDLTYRVDGSDH